MNISKAIVNGHEVEVITSENQPLKDGETGVNTGGCFFCHKKVGKISYEVHMSVCGELLPFDADVDFGGESQGLFQIGSECQKKLPRNFVRKEEM